MSLREEIKRRLRGGILSQFFLSKSNPFTVTLGLKQTYVRVDKEGPGTGSVPLKYHMEGYLMGFNPDGTQGGLGGKKINLIMDNVVVWTGTTGLAPAHPNGQIILDWTISTPGTHTLQTEFPGDAEWAGC